MRREYDEEKLRAISRGFGSPQGKGPDQVQSKTGQEEKGGDVRVAEIRSPLPQDHGAADDATSPSGDDQG